MYKPSVTDKLCFGGTERLIYRRIFALLCASVLAAAASGQAFAQMQVPLTFTMAETGTTTLAKEPFDATGVSKSPLWQTHSSEEIVYSFKQDGTGKVIGRAISQIGAIFDRTLQDNKTLLAAEETIFGYKFRYTVGKDFSLKIYVVPGSYVFEIVKGARKGLLGNVYYDDAEGTPTFEGHLNFAKKSFFLRNPIGKYFRKSSKNTPDTYGFTQVSAERPTEGIGFSFTWPPCETTSPPKICSIYQ